MDEPNYGTSGGVPVTDELVEGLAAQAEEGYGADQLKPRGTPDAGWSPQELTCPACRNTNCLVAEMRLKAQPQGTYSIAGAQPKVVAAEWPYLVCTTPDCGFTKAATRV